MSQLRNAHLSFSRLSRFEACSLSYALHYIEKLGAEPGFALIFGKALHWVLEMLLSEVVENEYVGRLSETRATELFCQTWKEGGLSGFPAFDEGVRILRRFVADQGEVDHRNILGIEKEFRIAVGPFTLLGYIDRIDAVNDETVEVIDYKSNFQLFSRDEVAASLQLALYEIAARQIWPWVKHVKLTYWMLRHSVRQETTRTPEQLRNALEYVRTLGEQMEAATSFPARINPNCVYCDHRRQCAAYKQALEENHEAIVEDLTDLEAVASERQAVANRAKIAYARKDELDRVLLAHLANSEHLDLGGVRFRMLRTTSTEYPLEPTVALLAGATDIPRDELLSKLGVVNKERLDQVMKRAARRMPKPRLELLKTELDAIAHKSHSPRLWAKEIP